MVTAGPRNLVTIEGPLDVSTAPRLRRALAGIRARQGGDIVVDLEGVWRLDAAGLGVLAFASKDAQLEGAQIHLLRPSPAVRRVLDISNMTALFDIIDAHTKALGATHP
jgi:anti-anti-sigma factor